MLLRKTRGNTFYCSFVADLLTRERIGLRLSHQERKLIFSSLSEESVNTSVLKSLLLRNSSNVRLKQWGIHEGVG